MRPLARLALALAIALALAADAWSWSRGSWEFGLCRLAFEYELAVAGPELEREAASGNSSVYYFTSYYLNGMLSAYEATGDERLLRRAVGVMDQMVARARVFHAGGRAFGVWGPFTLSADGPTPTLPHPSLHSTLQAAVPLARAAAIIRADPDLNAEYGASAGRYIAFVDGAVMRYFVDSQFAGAVPWLDEDAFPLWNDNATNLGLDAAFLCRATGDARACGTAKLIGEAFKAKLRPYKGGWIWENQTIPLGSDTDNTPGSVGNQAGVPDVSRTNREAFLMATLHEMGLVFTRADLDRMAATLSRTIWTGTLQRPSWANYLNGSDLPYRVYKKPGLNGGIYHGWALMGAYSPLAQAEVLATLRAGTLGGAADPALERNTRSYGALLALAGHALRNFRGPLPWRRRLVSF